ncbi:hypothetical protein D1007_39406 [Hordeum vulgare]|nr:hypothetical protein D1007_39406 [Hordeum vulgare]
MELRPMVHPHGAEHQPHQSFTELLLSVSRIRSIEPDPCLPQKSKDGLAEIGPEEHESSGEQTLLRDQHLQSPQGDVSTDPIMEVDESLPPCEDGSREAQPQTRRAADHPPVQNGAWETRFRHGKIPDQREPKQGRVSALGQAMRSYVDRKSGHVVAPEIGTEFDSLDEAFEFHNLYSWEIGFGIRYGQCRRNAQKSRTVQDFVCGCAVGKAKKRKHKFGGIRLPSIVKVIPHT